MNLNRRTLLGALSLAALPAARAQEWPSRPIRLVIPYPPGGSSDIIARSISNLMSDSLKHATHFKRHSQAGMVMVNLPTAGVDYHVPFGGRKGSSYGPREQGRYAQEFYTVVKTAYTAP